MNTLFKKIKIYIIPVICLLFILTTCAMPGKVYLSFSWRTDRDIPDLTFNCDAPHIPADINEIGKGGYYYTEYGNYTVEYNYSDDAVMRSLDIELVRKKTILGSEDAYYDFIFRREGPEFYAVPQSF
jgi:hypothetical protein